MIKSVGNVQPNLAQDQTAKVSGQTQDSSVFKGVLENQISKGVDPAKASADLKNLALKFSSHAIDRIQSRGIKLQPEDLKKLGEALDKAKTKGAKDTLVLMGDNAFVVSVKNNTVVTAMDKNALKENVFTNIDSTILI
jgi:flagellar operon protein